MATKGVVIQITGDGASAAKALELVDQHLRETAAAGKESASDISEAMETIRRRLEIVGLDLGIYAAVDGLKELVTSTLEFGEAIEKAHAQTGLAVSTLSTLHYAAAITGSEFDSLTSAVSKMDKTIGMATEGDKKAQAFMKTLGLNAKELAGRSDGAEVAFRKFTATLAATENPVRRVELATSLLGKAGATMIPVLMEVGNNWDFFRQKATDAGMMLNDQTAAALADTNKRLEDLKQHLSGASLAFTEGLTPSLTQMLSVASGGKPLMDSMREFGFEMGKGMTFAAMATYSLLSAMHQVAALGDGGTFTKLGKDQWDQAEKDNTKAMELRNQLSNGMSGGAQAPFMPETQPSGKGGFGGVGDLSKTKKPGTDGIARADEALQQANANAHLAALKSADALELAQMEADHKLFLSSDADYYRDRLAVQKLELNQEEDALRENLASLQALQAKQHSDKKLVRDKGGDSAEELKTQKDILDVQAKIAALEAKKGELDIAAKTGAIERGDTAHLASLKAAAELETQTNNGIQARLALMQAEQGLAMRKTTSEGGDVKTLAALQAQERELLQIADIERQINQVKEDGARNVGTQQLREKDDPTQRKAATTEINALNKQTAASLQALTAQYDALAVELGGDFIEKARALHAELDALNTPNKKQDMQPYETLGKGMESMAEQIAKATGKGRESFHKMTTGMEQDVLEMAVKFAMQKWMTPWLNGLAGGGGGGLSGASGFGGSSSNTSGLIHYAAGGDFPGGSPMMVGENGPELAFPSGPGTIMPNDALQSLGKTAGGGDTPSMTMNVTNASSQPVTARQTGSSFDSDTRSYMTHVILEDLDQGGPISAALKTGS
jgi:hypothetical protein